MTPTAVSSRATANKPDVALFGELLIRSAVGLRELTAVQALVEEKNLLALDNVRAALVTKEDGVMTCRWEGMGGRLYTLGLDDGERAFFGLVLSIVGVRPSYLNSVACLDEHRLRIVLQAMVRLAQDGRDPAVSPDSAA